MPPLTLLPPPPTSTSTITTTTPTDHKFRLLLLPPLISYQHQRHNTFTGYSTSSVFLLFFASSLWLFNGSGHSTEMSPYGPQSGCVTIVYSLFSAKSPADHMRRLICVSLFTPSHLVLSVFPPSTHINGVRIAAHLTAIIINEPQVRLKTHKCDHQFYYKPQVTRQGLEVSNEQPNAECLLILDGVSEAVLYVVVWGVF